MNNRLQRGDIFDEDGALTARFLLLRGYCCGNGCRNCPYEPRHGGPGALPRPEILLREGIPVTCDVRHRTAGGTMEGS